MDASQASASQQPPEVTSEASQQPPQEDASEALEQQEDALEAVEQHQEEEEEEQGEDSGNGEGVGGGGGDDEDEEEKLFSKAQKLMEKITSSHDNPNPNVLHALSSILETEESRSLSLTNSHAGCFFVVCVTRYCSFRLWWIWNEYSVFTD